jgi:hypothetical protein
MAPSEDFAIFETLSGRKRIAATRKGFALILFLSTAQSIPLFDRHAL